MSDSEKLQKFNTPYASIEEVNGMALLYSLKGDYSVVIKISNPVLQYAGDERRLLAAHQIFTALMGHTTDNYIVQKQDIFAKCVFTTDGKREGDWLEQSFFNHFNGREYIKNQTYLIITQQAKKGFFTFDSKQYEKFIESVENIIRLLASSNMCPLVLDRKMLKNYLVRSLAVNFSDNTFSLSNIEVDRNGIHIDDCNVKMISLVDLDEINFPMSISPYRASALYEQYDNLNFPEDNMTFLLRVPEVDTVIYTQTLFMPNQANELRRLKKKRNLHVSAMGEGNNSSAEDIETALKSIGKENKKLVYTNYSIALVGKKELADSMSYIEQLLFPLNIIPSKRCVNQFELFCATVLPANAMELKNYDRFLVPQDAALSLFYKESPQTDERTNFPVYFATRDNTPVAIDMFDAIITSGRVPNAHMCVIGPSGSGKSFFMNLYVRQNYAKGMHIVLIDVGHSYKGLCEYYNGKYITYTTERPITMNPFILKKAEDLTTDKIRFFLSLITVIWRGANHSLNKSEETVILNTIDAYYRNYFETIKNQKYLNFNSFYEFAGEFIEKQITENGINFELADFKYVLQKFTRNGIYSRILNEEADKTLFDEQFVIFEIDSIKDDPDLYPIVTLVIMDLFTGKLMALPRNIGKIFIIEEAWKSITSPVMQPYILWLWRTIRKYRGQAVVVTQEIQDLVDNPVIKNVIINNSPIICLLRQEKKTFKKLTDYLALSEAETNIVASLGLYTGNENCKEVYIKRGITGEVYRVIVSPQEYWTYTTRNEEKALLEKYKTAFEEGFAKQASKWIASQMALNSKYTEKELQEIYNKDHKAIEFAIEQIVTEQKEYIRQRRGLNDDFISYILDPKHSIKPNIPAYEKKLI